MKKIILAMLTSFTVFFGSFALADENTVLMFVRDGSRDLRLMLEEEVLLMKSMLEFEGYKVVVATADGEDLEADGVKVEVDFKVADVDMDDYGAIALPCMAPAPGSAMEEKVIELVAEAAAGNKPIAASRGSVAFVAEAGALKDKQFAFASRERMSALDSFQDGTFVGTGTQRDGLLSTTGICPLASRSTGLPDGTADLTRSFIQTLEERS